MVFPGSLGPLLLFQVIGTLRSPVQGSKVLLKTQGGSVAVDY